MAVPLKQITKERVHLVRELIKAGYTNSQIIDLVFVNQNGHNTGTYHQIINRIKKTIK